MSKNKKYKIKKIKKIFITLGLTTAMIASSTIAIVAKTVHDYSSSNNSVLDNNYSSETNKYVDFDNEYINVEYSDEKSPIKHDKTSTKISLNKFNYDEFINTLESYDYEFSLSEYYDLENTLKIFNSVKSQKKENTELISGNSIDPYKLYNNVIRNNDLYMKQDKNSVNTFFSYASDESIKNICNLIVEVYNNKNNYYNLKEVSDTLIHLKIFQNNTTSSNAYVTDDLVLAFNPTMMKMFSNTQEMTGNAEDGISIDKTIFIHEIEHLFQNVSNDFHDENGIETGFCRKFDKANVNSLWNTWLLEGSAEIKMAESLNTTPKNYNKKISYIRSYDLSRIFENDYEVNNLVNSVFTNNLNTAYSMLNINDDASKIEFLKLMYSIEITQSDVQDFWKFYEKEEKVTLTEEEKNSIRMKIRAESEKKLSEKYYRGLANGLLDGKIKDLETMFYLMRLWELDCCGHLNFTNKQEYEHAKDFIIWQDNIEKGLIKSIANSNSMSYDELINKYDNYHMSLEVNGNVISNADFSNLPKEKQEYIEASYDKYSITYFARTSTMVSYINNKFNTKESNVKN